MLQYRDLLQAESLNYELTVKYPLIWNLHQQWDLTFKGVKVSYHFLYAQKQFFSGKLLKIGFSVMWVVKIASTLRF